jgi:histone H3/H4
MAKKNNSTAVTATAVTTTPAAPAVTATKTAVTATAADKTKKSAKKATEVTTVTAVPSVEQTPVTVVPAKKAAKSAKTAKKAVVETPAVSDTPAPVPAKKSTKRSVAAAAVDTPPVVEASPVDAVDVASTTDSDDADGDADDDSVFNRNAVKRLVCIAGIPRMGNDVADRVNSMVAAWADALVDKATSLLEFTNHKTLNVADIQFLSERYPELLSPFLAPSKFSVKSCKKNEDLEKVLKGKQHGNVFTAKRTFDSFLHLRFMQAGGNGSSIRLGNSSKNNTTVLLQLLAEEYIVKTFVQARLRMDKRDTITAADLDSVTA